MKPGRHDDIEELISEIEHIRLNMNDHLLGESFWHQAMKDFAYRQGPRLIELLRELEKFRDHRDEV